MVKFDDSKLDIENFREYLTRNSHKNGVKEGYHCANGVCNDRSVGQINLLHDTTAPNAWEKKFAAFTFSLVEPGTDTPIEPYEEFYFKIQMMDLDSTMKPQPKMTKEIICLDMKDFYFQNTVGGYAGTSVPGFNEFQDNDYAIKHTYDSKKRCDGTPVLDAKSCVEQGHRTCNGEECSSCTGSVTVASDAVGFECDNPTTLSLSRTKSVTCAACEGAQNSKVKCEAPAREFRGMCIPNVTLSTSNCEQVARDAAMALDLGNATDLDSMKEKVQQQVQAARDACGQASSCEWSSFTNTRGIEIDQGCYPAQATPVQCSGKNMDACTGNCKWSQGNKYVIS